MMIMMMMMMVVILVVVVKVMGHKMDNDNTVTIKAAL